MASPRELDRRVSRNSNDIEALYDQVAETNDKVTAIAEVQQRHGEQIAETNRTVAAMAAVQQQHGNRLDHIDGRLDEHGRKLDTIIEMLGTK